MSTYYAYLETQQDVVSGIIVREREFHVLEPDLYSRLNPLSKAITLKSSSPAVFERDLAEIKLAGNKVIFDRLPSLARRNSRDLYNDEDTGKKMDVLIKKRLLREGLQLSPNQ